MLTSRLTIGGSVGGVSINSTIQRDAEGIVGQEPPLPAAKAGTLTTRTDNTSGTLTLGAGHGVTTGNVIDLYWDGGRRYNVTVGTVSGNTVPISGGAGDNLPVLNAAITAAVQTVIDAPFDGNLVLAIAAQCSKRARVEFYQNSSMVLGIDLVAGETWVWWTGGAGTNPLAGADVTAIKASQADTTAQTLKFGAQIDSVA
jgi:hypothetical protein